MLSELCQELEVYDARQEWGEHESVQALVDADVRPHLQECFDFVSAMLNSVAEVLQHQEDTQHNIVTKLVAFFLALAKCEEKLRKQTDEFEVQYNGDVEKLRKQTDEFEVQYNG